MGTQRFKNVFKTFYLGDSVHATEETCIQRSENVFKKRFPGTFKVRLKNVSKT